MNMRGTRKRSVCIWVRQGIMHFVSSIIFCIFAFVLAHKGTTVQGLKNCYRRSNNASETHPPQGFLNRMIFGTCEQQLKKLQKKLKVAQAKQQKLEEEYKKAADGLSQYQEQVEEVRLVYDKYLKKLRRFQTLLNKLHELSGLMETFENECFINEQKDEVYCAGLLSKLQKLAPLAENFEAKMRKNPNFVEEEQESIDAKIDRYESIYLTRSDKEDRLAAMLKRKASEVEAHNHRIKSLKMEINKLAPGSHFIEITKVEDTVKPGTGKVSTDEDVNDLLKSPEVPDLSHLSPKKQAAYKVDQAEGHSMYLWHQLKYDEEELAKLQSKQPGEKAKLLQLRKDLKELQAPKPTKLRTLLHRITGNPQNMKAQDIRRAKKCLKDLETKLTKLTTRVTIKKALLAKADAKLKHLREEHDALEDDADESEYIPVLKPISNLAPFLQK